MFRSNGFHTSYTEMDPLPFTFPVRKLYVNMQAFTLMANRQLSVHVDPFKVAKHSFGSL